MRASCCIPEPDCAYRPKPTRASAVWREGDCSNPVAMALERLLKRASCRIPEPDCLIVRSGREPLPSGEKATALTQSPWPSSVCYTGLPVVPYPLYRFNELVTVHLSTVSLPCSPWTERKRRAIRLQGSPFYDRPVAECKSFSVLQESCKIRGRLSRLSIVDAIVGVKTYLDDRQKLSDRQYSV